MKTVKIIISIILLSYCNSFSQTETKTPLCEMQVVVTDFDNNSKKGEQIFFEGEKTKKTFKGVTSAKGTFNIELPGNETYQIKIKTIGDAQDYSTITIPRLAEGESYSSARINIQFELPRVFTLDNVHFASGKATIETKSYVELNELVEFMTLKEDVAIEVAGHTDNVGEDDANLKLSQARAESVKQFLSSRGIAPERLIAKGYGEERPVDTNGTPQGRQKNRRTEVRIIKG